MRGRAWVSVGLLLVAVAAGLFLTRPREEEPVEVAARTARDAGAALEGEVLPPGAPAAAPSLVGVERARPESPPVAEAESADLDGVRLTGRVVDGSRRPVAGLVVVGHGPRESRATTDAEGRFALVAPRPRHDAYERVSLVARRGEGEVAVHDGVVFAAGPARVDVGTLVLVRGAALEVEVRADGTAVAGAQVLLQSWAPASAGQLRARGTTDAAGRCTLPPAPEGAQRVLAFAPGRGRALALLALPRETPGPLVLDLPAARRVDLTLVFWGEENPVVGATVELRDPVGGPGWATTPVPYLPALVVAASDAQGRVRVEGLAPADALLLRIAGGGAATAREDGLSQRQPARLPPQVTEARISVPRLRRIRWPVTDADGPPPLEGSPVDLRQDLGGVETSLPATARMDAGHLVADGVGPGHVHAFALTADGRIARLFAKDHEELGNPTSFRRARRVDVVVRHDDGTAPVGLAVIAHDQGNNPVGPAVPLDAQGRATLAGLYGGRLEVHLATPGEAFGQQVLGTVDLEAGDGRVEATVGKPRRGLVRVRIDGQPGLPGSYYLRAGAGEVQHVSEDPARGEVAFTWRPRGAGQREGLTFIAPTLLRADGRTGAFGSAASDPLPTSGLEPDVVEIDLVRGGVLLVRVTLPPDGRVSLGLERWDEARGAWAAHPLRTREGGLGPPPGGVDRFAPLPPGRYRAVEGATGASSAAAEVTTDGPPAEVALDLSAVGWVRGRVEVPAGHDLARARVRLEGLPRSSSNPATMPEGARVSPQDGGFGVRVPGGVPFTLVASHPTLVPSPDGGRVALDGPREGVVLRLVESTTARLLLDPAPGPAIAGQDAPLGRVLLFRGEAVGEPLRECQGAVEGGALTFGGYEPGTYTLWVDVAPHAPLTLAARTLGPGRCDLGTATFARGAEVRVRVLVPEGQSPPRLGVSVRREDAPAYVRTASSRGEALVTLAGLAPGKHRLTVFPQMWRGAQAHLDETITLEPDGSLERTLDLR